MTNSNMKRTLKKRASSKRKGRLNTKKRVNKNKTKKVGGGLKSFFKKKTIKTKTSEDPIPILPPYNFNEYRKNQRKRNPTNKLPPIPVNNTYSSTTDTYSSLNSSAQRQEVSNSPYATLSKNRGSSSGSSSGNTKKPNSIYTSVIPNKNPYNIPSTILSNRRQPKGLKRKGAMKKKSKTPVNSGNSGNSGNSVNSGNSGNSGYSSVNSGNSGYSSVNNGNSSGNKNQLLESINRRPKKGKGKFAGRRERPKVGESTFTNPLLNNSSKTESYI